MPGNLSRAYQCYFRQQQNILDAAPEMYRLAIWRDTDIKYYEEQIKRIIGISQEEYVPPIDKFGNW